MGFCEFRDGRIKLSIGLFCLWKDSYHIFNLDDVGFDSQFDTKARRYVANAENGYDVSTPVERTSDSIIIFKRITLKGEFTKPIVIMKKKTVDPIIALDLHHKIDLYFQDHAFMTRDLFEERIENVFLQHVDFLRKSYKFNQKVVSIMDNFAGGQISTPLIHEDKSIVDIMFIVPCFSHLCQPLDLCYFGFWKSFLSRFYHIMKKEEKD